MLPTANEGARDTRWKELTGTMWVVGGMNLLSHHFLRPKETTKQRRRHRFSLFQRRHYIALASNTFFSSGNRLKLLLLSYTLYHGLFWYRYKTLILGVYTWTTYLCACQGTLSDFYKKSHNNGTALQFTCVLKSFLKPLWFLPLLLFLMNLNLKVVFPLCIVWGKWRRLQSF